MEEQLGRRRQCGQHLDAGERLIQLCVAVVLVSSAAAGPIAGVKFDDGAGLHNSALIAESLRLAAEVQARRLGV